MLLVTLFYFGLLGLPIICGTLLVIHRRDFTAVQSTGLLLLVWLIPFFGFIGALAYVFFCRAPSQVTRSAG
jgi:hypothetical protein